MNITLTPSATIHASVAYRSAMLVILHEHALGALEHLDLYSALAIGAASRASLCGFPRRALVL